MKVINKNYKRKYYVKILLLKTLVILGLVIIILGLFNSKYKYEVRSENNVHDQPLEKVAERFPPEKLNIASIKVNLPIKEGRITNGVWEVSDDTVSYLNLGAYPGEKGNIVLYGHNTVNIFGRLKNVKLNDKITIYNTNGEEYQYYVNEMGRVIPDNVEIIQPRNYEVLTVYTCIGFLDSERLVIKAYPNK